jgi:LPXTG-site transpeptidase (sortase) family protein
MYRRQSGSSLLTVIVLGIVAGAVFLLYQQWSSPAAPVVPTSTPSPPTLAPTFTAAPIVIPTATIPVISARLSVPTAGILTPVVDVYLDGVSWDVSYLGSNAGHLQGTAWLDGTGNIVLAGHVENFDGGAGVFAAIDDLRLGDPVVLSDGAQVKYYAVTEVKTVQPDDLTVLYPTDTDRITLITCDGYDFVNNSYQQRIVVIAERAS